MDFTLYNVTLVLGGVVLFFMLMRLFSSGWDEVGECFLLLLKPQWLSILTGDFTQDAWKTLKLLAVALLSAYLVFVFHWKAGGWWHQVIE